MLLLSKRVITQDDRTVCVLNQLAVSKHSWEAADIPIRIPCMAKLLAGAQSIRSLTDLHTRFLRESARLRAAGFLQGQ